MKKSGIFGSPWMRGGAIVVIVLLPIILGCEYGTFIGIPFGNENELLSLTYWTLLITSVFPILPFIFFILGVGLGKTAILTASLAIFIVATLWQIYTFIYLLIIFATCEGDLQCAENLACDTTILHPYRGPTNRFIAAFASVIAMLVVELIAIGVSFATRALLLSARRYEMGVYGTSVGFRNLKKIKKNRDAANLAMKEQEKTRLEKISKSASSTNTTGNAFVGENIEIAYGAAIKKD